MCSITPEADKSLLNKLASVSSLAVGNSTLVTAQITANKFFGLTSSQIAYGSNTQTGNQFLATEPPLDTTHPWSQIALSIGLVLDTGRSASDKITANPAIKGTGQASTVVTIKEGGTTLGTTTADSTGAWSFAPVGLLAGTHTQTAFQTDLAGNTDTATLSFTLDNNLGSTALIGTEGNDTLTGTVIGLNVIYGLGGNDILFVSYSSATTEMYGGSGDDTVAGSTWGADYIDGGPGNDNLHGYWGNDVILGGDGNDVIKEMLK